MLQSTFLFILFFIYRIWVYIFSCKNPCLIMSWFFLLLYYICCVFYYLHYHMLKEFLGFLTQYNIVGIAVWLLIATKVWELVKWLIDDLITPLLLNPILTKLKVKKMEDLSYKWILYGKVIATLIDFLLVAFLVFLVVKYFHVIPAKK